MYVRGYIAANTYSNIFFIRKIPNAYCHERWFRIIFIYVFFSENITSMIELTVKTLDAQNHHFTVPSDVSSSLPLLTISAVCFYTSNMTLSYSAYHFTFSVSDNTPYFLSRKRFQAVGSSFYNCGRLPSFWIRRSHLWPILESFLIISLKFIADYFKFSNTSWIGFN